MEDLTLATVTHDPETDAVMTARKMPGLRGTASSNLLCGGCGEVIAAGADPDTIDRAFQTKRRLLLKCVCGANNLIHEARSDVPETN